MIYKPNEIDWKIGDIVIHDSDAKEEHMLMKVIEYTKDGLIKTELIDHYMGRSRDYHKPLPKKERVFVNDKKYLLDPKRFGIDTSKFTQSPSKSQVQPLEKFSEGKEEFE